MPRLKSQRPPPAAEVRRWFASPSAAVLLQAGNALLSERLESCFGSYLLEYQPLADAPDMPSIRRYVALGETADEHEIQSQECHWPIQPDSVDVVLLRHSLEFARSPYDLLREAASAVRPGGHLLVIGLNPYSLAGQMGRYMRAPWRRGRRLSAARVAEWLAVLGLACEPPRFARVPLRWWKPGDFVAQSGPPLRNAWHPGHACYLLAARKQVHVLPRQRDRLSVLPELMPAPIARQGMNADSHKIRELND